MIPMVPLHENTCTFCQNRFLTNAIARRHCPRCARLLRQVRANDARRARRAGLVRMLTNAWHNLCHPREVLHDLRRAEA